MVPSPEEAHPEGQLVNGTTQQVDSSKKGFHIKFSNIRFSVPKKEILKGISGTCQPGRVLAILGSSGAGKTTLLDILACNPTPGGRVQGEILVDGVPRRPVTFRRSACYVMQRDVLLAAATVREAITTSALLKLPMSMSHADKINKVNSILHELGLEECQNTLIGDDLMGIKGISGGQRRRVSIGIEVIKDPRVIFLDEPTSGLDSEMAAALMHTLKGLSRLGRTVVLTIHQPNSLITSEFDDFMLLSGGETVYNGPWEDAVAFFAAAGLQCPAYSNPTDFFLHTLQEPDNVKLLVNQQKEKEGIWLSESKKNLSADEENVLTEVEVDKPIRNMFAAKRLFCGLATKGDKEEESKGPGVPGWYQIKVLAARNLRNYMRNPVMFFSETAQYAFMGVFVGLMYLRLNNSVETGVQDRLASLWFGMAVLSFTPSFTAATVWDRERILLRREASQSLYSVTSWFAAKSAVVIPMQIAQTLLFGLIAFFMVGYALTVSNIFIYLASYALFQITSEAIGVLCAALTSSSTSAILALTFVLLVLLSFSGFLVANVPVYFRWVRTISFLTYAYDAVGVSEFQNTNFVCTTGPPACPQQGEVIPGLQLLPSSMENGLAPGINLLVLLGITVGTRILCFVAIYASYKLRFL